MKLGQKIFQWTMIIFCGLSVVALSATVIAFGSMLIVEELVMDFDIDLNLAIFAVVCIWIVAIAITIYLTERKRNGDL